MIANDEAEYDGCDAHQIWHANKFEAAMLIVNYSFILSALLADWWMEIFFLQFSAEH